MKSRDFLYVPARDRTSEQVNDGSLCEFAARVTGSCDAQLNERGTLASRIGVRKMLRKRICIKHRASGSSQFGAMGFWKRRGAQTTQAVRLEARHRRALDGGSGLRACWMVNQSKAQGCIASRYFCVGGSPGEVELAHSRSGLIPERTYNVRRNVTFDAAPFWPKTHCSAT